jgi:tRNA G37 N-methylase TrmD
MFPGPLGVSLAGKALAQGIWSLDALDIRAHATTAIARWTTRRRAAAPAWS